MAKGKKKTAEETEAKVNETVVEEKADETAAAASDDSASVIEELNKKLLEANDKYLRTVAEYDNFRKRSQKEKEAIYSDSKSDIIGKLLPVIDNFERAVLADSDFESYKTGINMTVKQLLEIFGSLGVEAFGEAGEEFDPNIHNGIMHVDDESLGENVISQVYAKGYRIGDKIIRHATVIVAN